MKTRFIRFVFICLIMAMAFLYQPNFPNSTLDESENYTVVLPQNFLPNRYTGIKRVMNPELPFTYALQSNEVYVGFGKSELWFSIPEVRESSHFKIINSLSFRDSNDIDPEPLSPSATRFSSLYGSNSDNWILNETYYTQIVYSDIYPSIDLVFTSKSEGLKYDFKVHPGGNPALIELEWSGDMQMILSDSSVVLSTSNSMHGHKFEDNGLQVTQENKPLSAKFVQTGPQMYGFQIDPYDVRTELIIDPLIRFSTTFGGSASDIGMAITQDSEGNLIVVGSTQDAATDFPTTPGAYQVNHNGSLDLFVSKLTPNGSQVIFSTFIGGTGADVAYDVKVDSSDNVLVCGYGSSDFPTTLGAYNQTHSGGRDAILSKLSKDGSTLLFSTFIGGGVDDEANELLINSDDTVFMTGYTTRNIASSQLYFPRTPGAYSPTLINGYQQIFITHFSSDGSTLIASTVMGEGNSISIDIDTSTGDLVIAGESLGSTPTTASAFNETHSGSVDVFISRITQNLTNFLASTFIGGTELDRVHSVKVDSTGAIVVAGSTFNDSFSPFPVMYPTTSNAYNRTNQGTEDGFVSRFSGNLSILLGSTLIGGTTEDIIYDLEIDNDDGIIIVGSSYEYDPTLQYPTTNDAINSTILGGQDVIVSKLSSNCSTLIYSTYLGTIFNEYAKSVYIDDRGRVYITGENTGDLLIMGLDLFTRPAAPATNYTQFYTDNPLVQISWSEPDPGLSSIVNYQIFRGTALDSMNPVVTTTLTSYSELINESYYFQIAAISGLGVGARSPITQINPIHPPSEPIALEISIAGSDIFLNWTIPIDTGGDIITNFKIYRGTTSQLYDTNFIVNAISYLDSQIEGDTTYYYVVTALNTIAESQKSLEVSLTTPTFIPPTITQTQIQTSVSTFNRTTTQTTTQNQTVTSIVTSNFTYSSTIYNITTTFTERVIDQLSPVQETILNFVSSTLLIYAILSLITVLVGIKFYRRRRKWAY